MKYYSTQRPITPGGYPKPLGNHVLEIANYEERTFCVELGREVWGYIEYEKPLAQYDSDSYELMPVPTKTLHLRYLGQDSWGRYVYEDESGNLWKLLNCCLPREMCEETCVPHSALNNEFDGEPDYPMSATTKAQYV